MHQNNLSRPFRVYTDGRRWIGLHLFDLVRRCVGMKSSKPVPGVAYVTPRTIIGQFHVQSYQICGKWTSEISSGVCYWRKRIDDVKSAYHVRGEVLYMYCSPVLSASKVNSSSLAFIDLPFGSVMMTPKLPPSSEFIQVLLGLLLRRACVGGRPRSLLLWHTVSLGAQPPFRYRLDMLV